MRLYHLVSTAALVMLAAAQSHNLAFTSTPPTGLQAGFLDTTTYSAQSINTQSEGLPISSANASMLSTASIESLPVMITGNTSSLANLTTPPATNMSLTAAPVLGSGVPMGNITIMLRNQTMSISEPSTGANHSNGAASSTAGGVAAGVVSTTASSTQATANSTSSAGAAVGSMNVGSGSTLALVLAAVAMIVL